MLIANTMQIMTVNVEGEVKKETRGIIIHRPHPDPEMRPEVLQGIGRRCTKHFGWGRMHFATL